MTDHGGAPPEIEIQTNETPPIVYTRSFVRTDDQDVLTTTASNAEVVLTRNWKKIRGGHDWVAPLGTLLAIGLGLLTTDFATRFGVSADVWKAIFMVGTVLSVIWLVRELIRRWMRGSALTPQGVVDLLMTPPSVTPSKSAPAAAKSVGGENPAEPQTHSAGSQEKTPVSASEHGAVDERVALSTPPSTLGGLGRWRRPSPAAVQGQAHGSEITIVPDSANSGDPTPTVSPGVRVRHPNFGVGTVIDVRPGPGHMFVEVEFDDPDVGTKKLREDLAPLRPAGDEE